jgi:hypothetical protein
MKKHTTELIKVNDEFHHCATIAINDNWTWVAFYNGKECTDDQRVVITCSPESGDFITYELGSKTGNPILWSENGYVYLLYSQFEDKDEEGNEPRFPVERWKYCSNHVARLHIDLFAGISFEYLGEVEDGFGLLGRCQPIEFNGKILLPLYREKDPRCEIWESNNGNLKRLSVFGEMDEESLKDEKLSYMGNGVAIQPTLIVDDDGNLCAFCRNVVQSHRTAWCSKSKDGIEWEDIRESTIANFNSSLVYVAHENYKLRFVICNPRVKRDVIILYSFVAGHGISLGIPMYGSKIRFSYPNYCWDSYNNLHIVHSNCSGIAHHVFSLDILDEIFNLKLSEDN